MTEEVRKAQSTPAAAATAARAAVVGAVNGPATASAGNAPAVDGDRFVLIRIQGMHCHRCEQAIKKALQRRPGVHEVEVDFASGQASILFNPALITIDELIAGVKETGYTPVGFTQSHAPDSVS